jgi:UDP-N-acetylglucosamine--N-acetylmuramyl-(pentapeptide) pyrophosphoryl-undecaprenol N-acetylglucosamine transferase
MNNIMIITGGTGGHITPAIALAEELVKRNLNPIFITDEKFKKFNFKIPSQSVIYSIDSTSPFKKGIKNKILFPFKAVGGFFKALKIIKQYNPKVLVSFGGYMSFPTLLAAIFLNKKYILQEQNSILGKANRFFASKAYIIATSFRKIYNLEDKHHAKVVYIGNLVRQEFINIRNSSQEDPMENRNLNILVVGGSQGAKIFTEILPRALSFIPTHYKDRISVVQQAKEEDVISLRYRYQDLGIKAEIGKFFANIYDYYKKSNLIIARAGGSTIAEINALGKAVILVPFLHAADNHQLLNAKSLVYEGSAWCIEENNEIVKKLSDILNKILDNFEILELKTESSGKNFSNGQIKLADIIESI